MWAGCTSRAELAPIPDTTAPADQRIATDTSALLTTAEPGPGVSTGSAAPDFQLTLFSGETLRLSELKGKVVVLNLWASWCGPCRQEMPSFERTWQEYRDRGVVFLGVAVSDTEQDARAFAQQVGVTYPLGLDTTGQISQTYRPVGLPSTYFIDRQGNIARKLTGAANEAALRIFLRGQLEEE